MGNAMNKYLKRKEELLQIKRRMMFLDKDSLAESMSENLMFLIDDDFLVRKGPSVIQKVVENMNNEQRLTLLNIIQDSVNRAVLSDLRHTEDIAHYCAHAVMASKSPVNYESMSTDAIEGLRDGIDMFYGTSPKGDLMVQEMEEEILGRTKRK